MTNTLVSILKKDYPLKEIDVGDMSKLKANGMTFTVNAYRAEGLGHVSVMRAKGFFGLMKMDTLIVNPTAVDLPLYSYDRIYAMGNDTLIVELYDTLLAPLATGRLDRVNEQYSELHDRDAGEHWYDSIKLPQSVSKKGKKAQSETFDRYAFAHLEAYLQSSTTPVVDLAAKQEKASYYVEGLLKNGGPSTDVFKKSLGEEKTAELFRNILFGTKST